MIVHQALPTADDPLRRRPHLRRANRLLCWSSQTNLTDGLSQTINWFRRKLADGQVAPTPLATGSVTSRLRASGQS